jgi:hypothetical protein
MNRLHLPALSVHHRLLHDYSSRRERQDRTSLRMRVLFVSSRRLVCEVHRMGALHVDIYTLLEAYLASVGAVDGGI